MPPDNFLRRVATLASGSLLATLISTLSLPFLTRLFSPEAFGAFAMFSAVVTIVGVVACLRFEATVLLPEDERNAIAQFYVCILTAATVACCVLILGIPIQESQWFTTLRNAVPHFLLYISVYVFFHGLCLAISAWCSRQGCYRPIAHGKVCNQLVTSGLAIGSALAGHASALALITALLAGRALSVLYMALLAYQSTKQSLHAPSRVSSVLSGMKRYRKFPLLGTWSALLSTAAWQLPVLLLGGLFTPAIAGLYLLGFRVLQAPMNMIGNAVSTVFLQQAAEARRTGQLGLIVAQLYSQILRATLVPLVLLGMNAIELYSALFGREWAEAGFYTQLLCAWAFFWFLSGPLTGVFSVLEQQRLQLQWNVVNFMCRLAAILTGALFGSVETSIALLSVVGVVIYGWKTLMTLQLAQADISACGRQMLHYLLLGACFAVVMGVVQLLSPHAWIELISAFLLCFCYLLVAYRGEAGGLRSLLNRPRTAQSAGGDNA